MVGCREIYLLINRRNAKILTTERVKLTLWHLFFHTIFVFLSYNLSSIFSNLIINKPSAFKGNNVNIFHILLALSNIYNLTLPLNMHGMFLACLNRTHLSFLNTTLNLVLFCLFTPFLVWNEKLVTSSHGRQLFRELNSRHCLFLMPSTCLERKACENLCD